MKIDAPLIERHLQEIGGKCVRLKLDKKMGVGLSIRESDSGFFIRLNPTRIRNPNMLNQHLEQCRNSIRTIQVKEEE